MPLSCLVDVGGLRTKRFISVYEPHISYYSRISRVMVSYDSNRVEWCCPCSKPRQSCIHKCIAKWHLFQMAPDLFKSIHGINGEAIESSQNAAEDVEELVQEGAQYPPEDPVMSQMVRYIFQKKSIANLPPELLQSKREFPQHLIPTETICTECTGQTPLGKPQLITSKAKIVTVTDTIEDIFFSSLFFVTHCIFVSCGHPCVMLETA